MREAAGRTRRDAAHARAGYWLVEDNGTVTPYNGACNVNGDALANLRQPVRGLAPTLSGGGVWCVASDGGVFPAGDAPFLGSSANHPAEHARRRDCRHPSGQGYWLVTSSGTVIGFGDAKLFSGPLTRNGCPSGLVNDPSIRYKIGRRGIRVLAYYVKATTGARVVVTCSRGCKRTVTTGRGSRRVRIRVTVTRPGRLTTVVNDRVSHGRRIEGRARCTRPGTTTSQVGC